MNLLLFAPDDLCDGSLLTIEAERAEHLRGVLKVQVGSTVRVGMTDGGKGIATVRDITATAVVLELVQPLSSPDPRPQVDLLLALPRPQSLKKILQDISAIGVDRLTLFGSARVEKSYFHSPLLKQENLSHYVRLGLEQGMSTAVPKISVVRHLRDALPEMASCRSLLLHPLADEDLLSMSARLPFRNGERVLLIVGPEGGFRDDEVEKFRAFDGCSVVRLMRQILRVETAVCVGLGQLSLFLRP